MGCVILLLLYLLSYRNGRLSDDTVSISPGSFLNRILYMTNPIDSNILSAMKAKAAEGYSYLRKRAPKERRTGA